jgi:putative FmdB family regulatory protein
VPLYEYECPAHGVFETRRTISESAEDGPCPVCEQDSPRIVSAPNLGSMARAQVKAIERNERSRFEPKVVKTVAQPATERKPLQVAHGGYPWAVGH